MSIENRRDERFGVKVAAEVTVGEDVVAAATQNVSRGGVALLIDRDVGEGATVAVTLFLTQDGIEDPDEEPFESQASVVWTAEQDDGSRVVGVRFDKVTRDQAAQLERFLSALGET